MLASKGVSRLFIKKTVCGLSVLKDLGVFDSCFHAMTERTLKSDISVALQARYGMTEAQLQDEVKKYGKQILLLLFLPHAQVTIPSMIVFELLKVHITANKTYYFALFARYKHKTLGFHPTKKISFKNFL